jgi:hypothetical protein
MKRGGMGTFFVSSFKFQVSGVGGWVPSTLDCAVDVITVISAIGAVDVIGVAGMVGEFSETRKHREMCDMSLQGR